MLQRSGRHFTPHPSHGRQQRQPATTSTASPFANSVDGFRQPTYLILNSTGFLSYVQNCGRDTSGKDHPSNPYPAICFGTWAGESCCKRMVIQSGHIGKSDCLSDCDVGDHAICSNRHPATKAAECRVVTRSLLSSVPISCCVADYLMF